MRGRFSTIPQRAREGCGYAFWPALSRPRQPPLRGSAKRRNRDHGGHTWQSCMKLHTVPVEVLPTRCLTGLLREELPSSKGESGSMETGALWEPSEEDCNQLSCFRELPCLYLPPVPASSLAHLPPSAVPGPKERSRGLGRASGGMWAWS